MSSGSRRFRWSLVLRFALGVGLLSFLVSYIDLDPILSSLAEARPGWILLGAGFVALGNLVSSVKLWFLDRALGKKHGYWELVVIYYIGIFFNNFLPTSVGGDLMKIRKLAGKLDLTRSAGAVFLSRALGLLTLYGMATITVLIRPGILKIIGLGWLYMPLLLGAAGIVLLVTAILRYGRRAYEWIPVDLIRDYFDKFFKGLDVTDRRFKFLGLLFGFSVLFHVLNCFGYWSLIKSVGETVPVHYLFLVVPLVAFVSMIPWSFGALGIRETAITFFFTALSLTPAQSFSIAVMFRLISYLNSAAGGICYIFYEGSPAGD